MWEKARWVVPFTALISSDSLSTDLLTSQRFHWSMVRLWCLTTFHVWTYEAVLFSFEENIINKVLLFKYYEYKFKVPVLDLIIPILFYFTRLLHSISEANVSLHSTHWLCRWLPVQWKSCIPRCVVVEYLSWTEGKVFRYVLTEFFFLS